MAGSYNHVTKDDGSLRQPARVLGMLEANGCGDVYEAIEEMYGMIWYLADNLMAESIGTLDKEDELRARYVEDARRNYKWGLNVSPTKRFKSQD